MSKTFGYLICGVAGLAGGSVCLYATDHRSAYLIMAVVAAIVAVIIIGVTAITMRRARHPRFPGGGAFHD